MEIHNGSRQFTMDHRNPWQITVDRDDRIMQFDFVRYGPSYMAVAAAKLIAIATDSTDTEVKTDEDVWFVDGDDSEARAGIEEMKLINDDVKIEFETGKRKHVDDSTTVKRDQGQSTFKNEEEFKNLQLISCR